MIQEHDPRSDGERKANLMIRKIAHLFECFMLEKTMVDFGMLYESFILRFGLVDVEGAPKLVPLRSHQLP